MADMDPLTALGQSHGLRIIEDAAQSHGAEYHGRPVGDADLATYSFYATKNITTGEGGMVTTNDDAVADRLRILRNQGMRKRYVYEVAGHNYRLTDLQAAVAIPQLACYDSTLAARRRNANRLIEGLEDVPGVEVPRQLDGRGHVWHQFTVRITEASAVPRDEFVAQLGEAGIGAGVYYPRLLLDYDAYRDHPRVKHSSTPVARRLATEVLSLPVHPHLTESEVSIIIDAVTRIALGR
jgi:perosamine synthetase